jgi:hypothetical protein
MTRYTVRLVDNTVGTIDSDVLLDLDISELIGDTIAVILREENGFPQVAVGKLAEVLSVDELC